MEVTDCTFTKFDILEMESKIILSLDFNLTIPSPLRFLDRYSRLINEHEGKIYFFARYLIEISLLNESLLEKSASNIAASALYLSLKIFKKKECWNSTLTQHSKYRETDIRPCAKDLCLYLIEF